MKEYKKYRLLLLFYLSFTFISNIHNEIYAQGKEWERAFITSIGTDYNKPIIQFGNCGESIYVAGSYNSGSNGFDGVITKYNHKGEQKWVVTFDGTGNANDEFLDMVVDANENVYVVGYTTDGNNNILALAQKYNKDGTWLWTNTYGVQQQQNFLAVTFGANQSDLFITGYVANNPATTGYDALVYKIDVSGSPASAYSLFNGSGNGADIGVDIVYNPIQNKVYAAINTDHQLTYDNLGNPYMQRNIQIREYATSGSINVSRALINNADGLDDAVTELVVDPTSGNMYGTGLARLDDSQNLQNPWGYNQEMLTFKLDKFGALVWQRHEEGPALGLDLFDEGRSIILDENENVYVSGYSEFSKTMTTVKYNSSGVQQWINSFDGIVSAPAIASGNDLAIDRQNGLYIAGKSNGWLTQKRKLSDGTIFWTDEYGPQHIGNAIAVDKVGNVYTAGVTKDGSNYQFTLCKFSQSCFDTYSKIFNMTTNTSGGIISGIHKGRNKMEAGSSAGGGILSSGVVFNHPGSNVELIAGKQIIFYPNFRAKGTVSNRFLAKVDMCLHTTCQNSGATEFEKPGKPASVGSTATMNDPAKTVMIYPNPAQNEISVVINDDSDQPATLTLIDYTGKVVRKHADVVSGKEVKISLDGLTSGMYIAVVQRDGIVLTTEKLSVIK